MRHDHLWRRCPWKLALRCLTCGLEWSAGYSATLETRRKVLGRVRMVARAVGELR